MGHDSINKLARIRHKIEEGTEEEMAILKEFFSERLAWREAIKEALSKKDVENAFMAQNRMAMLAHVIQSINNEIKALNDLKEIRRAKSRNICALAETGLEYRERLIQFRNSLQDPQKIPSAKRALDILEGNIFREYLYAIQKEVKAELGVEEEISRLLAA